MHACRAWLQMLSSGSAEGLRSSDRCGKAALSARIATKVSFVLSMVSTRAARQHLLLVGGH